MKTVQVQFRVGHLFCGMGGMAKGFRRANARVGSLQCSFVNSGGIDSDAAALRDFERLAGVPGTLLDLFDREQFIAFHGQEPPASWSPAVPSDVRRALGPHLDVLTLSAPCKGFSGLLSETASRSEKYQALNGLTLRGIFLTLEAYADDPIKLIVFENVPRIATRGRYLLDQIVGLLRSYGYAVAETTHDCGELGGLAQSRKRFLLVGRHAQLVPPFLYEPTKRALRGVGEVLDKLPLPLSGIGGPMHRMPSLHWQTWVRLAFVRAGSDWRSLNDLRVENGTLVDFGIAPEGYPNHGTLGVKRWEDVAATVTGRSAPRTGAHSIADPRAFDQRGDFLGVREWTEPTGTVSSRGFPTNGAYSVADPRPPLDSDRAAFGVGDWEDPAATITSQRSPGQGRFAVADPRVDGHHKSVQMGVRPWDKPAGVVTGKMFAGGGPNSVADPRLPSARYNHVYRIVPWGAPSPSVTSANGGTAAAVADPRYQNWHPGASSTKLRVTDWQENAFTVTGSQQVASGALSVADPRPEFAREGREEYLTQGHYGVLPYDAPSGAVTAHGQHDNGRWSVADPRLPTKTDRLVCVIRALDCTWHRPFTTLELAALQSLVDPEEFLELDGLSDTAWRERIGNAVPPDAAEAIGGVCGRTLLLAMSGQTFMLSNEPIWVQPIAIALMAAQGARP